MRIQEAWLYIKSDVFRYHGSASLLSILVTFATNHCFRWQFFFRLSKTRIFIFNFFRRYYSIKYGIQIPKNTQIGYGLYIGHGVGVIVNPTAVIGSNCNLSQFLTIGSNQGKSAIIGDNVYIAPSVCIVENVTIGNSATIGAGAVIVSDIPENATAVGVPAKVVNYNSPGRFIQNPWIT